MRWPLRALGTPRLSAEDVEWVYRTILHRAPESASVVEHHRAKSGLRELVGAFVASPEFAKVSATSPAQLALPPGEYLSLGSHCYSSSFLRRLGVRRWSGPFDWTFSSLPMVADCLDDDFASFLDRDQFEPVPIDQRPNGPTVNRVQHRRYRADFGVEYVFNHHDVHLDDPYAYLQRCVDRFRRSLAGSQTKVFLATCTENVHSGAEIDRLTEALTRRSTSFHLVVMLIQAPDGAALPSAEKVIEGPRTAAYRYRPASNWGAVWFDEPIDEACMARVFALEAVAALLT